MSNDRHGANGRFVVDPRRAAVVAEARTWVGTAFAHQAAEKGVGCDCGGLIRGVGVAAGVLEMTAEDWRPWAAYARAPNPRRMGEAMRLFLRRIRPSQALPGDVLWLQWREDLPMHLAILADFKGRPSIIHAYSGAVSRDFPEGRVVEHGYGAEWPARLHSAWRYPGFALRATPGAAPPGGGD